LKLLARERFVNSSAPWSQSKRKAGTLDSVADAQFERYRNRGVSSIKYTQYHTFVQSVRRAVLRINHRSEESRTLIP